LTNVENTESPAPSGGISSNEAKDRQGLLKKLLHKSNERKDQNSSASQSSACAQPVPQTSASPQSPAGALPKVAPSPPAPCSASDRPASTERALAPQTPTPVNRSVKPDNKGPPKPQEKEKIQGIDADVYQKIVEVIGKPIPRKRKINTDLALKMHKAGWSYKQIGKYFKVSGCTVRRRLREAGLR
jgi:hypothetical protein